MHTAQLIFKKKKKTSKTPNNKNSLHNLNCISNNVALSHLITYWILWHVFQLLKSIKKPQWCFFRKLCTWVSWIPIPQCHLLNTDWHSTEVADQPSSRRTGRIFSTTEPPTLSPFVWGWREQFAKYYEHIPNLKAFQRTTLTDTSRFGRLQEPILAVFSTNTFNICTHKSKQVFQNSSFHLWRELHTWELAPWHHHTFNLCKTILNLSQEQDSQYCP